MKAWRKPSRDASGESPRMKVRTKMARNQMESPESVNARKVGRNVVKIVPTMPYSTRADEGKSNAPPSHI